MIDKIDAIDPLTVGFHLKEPYASFLWNLIPSAAGIVPSNAAPISRAIPSAPAIPFRQPIQTTKSSLAATKTISELLLAFDPSASA